MNNRFKAMEIASLPRFAVEAEETFEEFKKKLLDQSSEFAAVSDNRLRVMMYERLAAREPELQATLDKNRSISSAGFKAFLREPEDSPELRDGQTFSIPETKEQRIQRLFPKIAHRALSVPFNTRTLAKHDIGKGFGQILWDACTVDVSSPFYYPQWTGDVEKQCPYESGMWVTWAYPETDLVEFVANFVGDGKSAEIACAHTATFWWYFTAERTEKLRAWIEFDLSGPSAYKLNDGDVGIWILPQVEVKEGWGSEWDKLKTVFFKKRWVHTWLSTYGGPVIDGGVPQGDIRLNFHPTPHDYFSFPVSREERYIVSVHIQIALLSTYDGAIGLGDWERPCRLKGDCVMCRFPEEACIIRPRSSFVGESLDAIIDGDDLQGATDVDFSKTGVTATVVSSTTNSVDVKIDISDDTRHGWSRFNVTTPQGTAFSSARGFLIEDPNL